MEDPAWTRSPEILFKADRIREFFPSRDMSPTERLNATTRFVILATLLTFAFTREPMHLALGAAILATVALVLLCHDPTTKENFYVKGSDAAKAHDYKDSRVASPEKESCTRPTKDNPFMNLLPTDPRDKPPACDYDDVKDEILEHTDDFFHRGMFESVTDIYNTRTTERQFYTQPSTTPGGDSIRFANFLFGQGPNCKSDRKACTGADRGPKSNVAPLEFK
jgi:hypothetical protein